MKNLLLTLLIIIFPFTVLMGKQVTPDRARNVAVNFLNSQNNVLKSAKNSELQIIDLAPAHNNRMGSLKSAGQDTDAPGDVYLFKHTSTSFVLVAGDDLARPILAYSTNSNIDENNLPVNFLKWVNEYQKQVRYLRNLPQYKSSKPNNEWQQLENGQNLAKASPNIVNPLMTTTWNQSPYYNDLCPQANWYSEKSVTGCVATAMAQIMKYHNHPKQGSGINTYYHSNNTVTYGNITANFGNTTYNWGNMPNALNASSTPAQIAAVATLMFHCGVSVNMNYSPNTSGAWVTEAKTTNGASSEMAFKKYFGYNVNTVKGVQREGLSTSQWIQLIKNDLDAGLPVLFAGVGDGGGHAFVADGYDNNNFFHMNWGWGGLADGYYSTDAFNPYDLGTGAGGGSYNWYQRVVVGVKPPTQTNNNELYLYSDITVPDIYQFNEFRIDLKIYNLGSDFNGELGAALFDQNGDYVEFIETFSLSDSPLLNQKVYNVWFDSEGLSVYPGMYYIGIYYKAVGDNWVALPEIPDGGVSNFIQVEVLSPFTESEIILYDSIRISPPAIITGQAATITASIANIGNYTYQGEFGAGLFTRQGDVVQTIDVIDAGGLDSYYYDTYQFTSTNIDAEPGSYLIGLVHFPGGGDDQYVIAPHEYQNPVQVNVTLPPLGPDSFEDNNTTEMAYEFDVEYEDNYSGFYTLETNLHNSDDQDYYYINLPQGYNYTITARANDSYSSIFDDEEYTCDVIWAHSNRNYEWSEMYDDEMPASYTFYNGGEVYFGVISYFEGETGTYSFIIEIDRSIYTGSEQNLANNNINIYPNPFKNNIQINSPQIIESYELFDCSGQLLQKIKNSQKNFSIDASGLKAGIYYLKLQGNQFSETHKIIKHE
ncbi:MAG TPA: thiol protease/hemagglutinin PrtT [Prolixibacteraceae bacterium]|nr:thiol protease/hemagglutinin PrtT [Prolixibacteraceae bacterium]